MSEPTPPSDTASEKLEPISPTDTDLSRRSTVADVNTRADEPQGKKDEDAREAALRRRSTNLATTLSRIVSAEKPPEFSIIHEVFFVTIICLAQLLTQAGLAHSIAPLHVIGADLGNPSAGQLSWLPAAYSLTVGTFILPAGRWGDLFGHRLLFAIGYAWYAVWSLVTGFAYYPHKLQWFCVCRALQGIGPALLIPNGLAILGRTYPPGRRKNMVFSLFGATAPGGYVFGAVFSGIFAQLAWWPWIFWMNAIVLGVCCILVFVIIPPMPVAGGKLQKGELDIWGTLLGVSGLVMFNFAWNQGPAASWHLPYVYVLLIVGTILLGIFLYWELQVADFPLLPRSAFNKTNSLVLGCIALGWASFGIWVFYYWQFLELLRFETILEATVHTVPVAIVGAIAAISTGFAIGSLGPGIVMLMAMCAFLTGNILVGTAPVDQIYWKQTFVSMIITPFGMDMSFPAGSLILSNHMPREFQGVAASILCVIQNYSISIGLGMAGTVESHVSGGDLLKGYRGAWYLAMGFDGLGILCALVLVVSWRAMQKAKKKEQEKPVAVEEG